MFDIGFFELSLIGVVALVVIGPERLPAVARTAGKWVGRANRFVSNIKEDISKEIKDEELQKILQDQQKLASDFKQAADNASSAINSLNTTEKLDDLLEIDESHLADEPKKKKKKKKKKKSSDEISEKNNASIDFDSTTESQESTSPDSSSANPILSDSDLPK
ncbi:MAG: Sec-independent protein translocase protein TatB [Pseudomonadota bacterium]